MFYRAGVTNFQLKRPKGSGSGLDCEVQFTTRRTAAYYSGTEPTYVSSLFLRLCAFMSVLVTVYLILSMDSGNELLRSASLPLKLIGSRKIKSQL